ncbi:MAG: D-alanyl-D-alanine carboxypeptidase [Desulfobulbaceae bacterium]|nr:D-alanyl-D-alanine carboxypeptidase [Desulfobulbaceae bacterium]
MKKRTLLSLALSICFFSLFSTSVVAADVPVLKDYAKQRALSITLGRFGDISKVKARINGQYIGKRNSSAILNRISSKCVVIMDGDTGKIIYAKSPDTPRQPASTIKVLTGMIAIKSLTEEEPVEVSRYASSMPRSKVYLKTRKKYRAEDLINAVLLASANDASVALAEKIAGSEKRFAKMMNLRARLWGASQTVCQTATGLTAKGQQSTARDLAVIFRHAMQEREFVERMSKVTVKTSYGKVLRNHNKALWKLEGAIAGKTGFTRAAGQTYVGKFTRGGESIIVAVMGSDTMWDDIENLVEYGFNRQAVKLLSDSGKSVLRL